jgi:hypothetical protein
VATPRSDDPGGPSGTGVRGGRLRGADALRLHLTLGVGLAVCAAAFVVEVSRALGGNTLSWAYVFEWPIFAAFALYMWWHLLHGQDGSRRSEAARPAAPARGAGSTRGTGPSPDDGPAEGDDADLRAWQAYLRDLEADDARRAQADGRE